MPNEENLCTQEMRNIVKEIVQAIMILDHSKKPFKQSDIVSQMNEKPTRKNWKEVFSEARKSLNSLGLELHETKDTSINMYFVINKNRTLPIMHKYATEEEISNRILLIFVLIYIFMKNGAVDSDELLNHLKDLDIYSEVNPIHPYFGNVKKKVLFEFVEQLYLSVSKKLDLNLLEVSWGQRAEAEINKRDILDFVCQYGYDGKIKPQNLVFHYEKVKEQEAKESLSQDHDDISSLNFN